MKVLGVGFPGHACKSSEVAVHKLGGDLYTFFQHEHIPTYASNEEKQRREREQDYDPLADIKVNKESVQQLYHQCKAYRLWRLHNVADRNEFSSFVTAETFRTWARLLIL